MKSSIFFPKSTGGSTLDEDIRFGSQRKPGSRVLDKNGDINAGSFQELAETIVALANASSQGHVSLSENQAQAREESRKANAELLNAAWDNREALAALGNVMAETIQETSNREGFMRRFLLYQELVKGSFPRARVDPKNVQATIATGPTTVDTQFVRDKTVFPPEFYIFSRPYVEQKDIEQTTGDILDETYTNALTAFMVQEDITWKTMADEHRGIENENVNIAGPFLPGHFAELASLISRWGVAPAFCLIANNVWGDITSNASTWQSVFDPITKYEIVKTGKLGTLNGIEMLSDHFRHEHHKVLDAGDIYVVGEPVAHGQYTDRGGVVAQATDIATDNVPGRGWAMYELMSMAVINGRSVAHAQRSGKFPSLAEVSGTAGALAYGFGN